MFPIYADIEDPLVEELHRRGGQARPSDRGVGGLTIYDSLAAHFCLTASDLDVCVYEADGTPRSKWENMVRFAVRRLKDKGIIYSPQRGVWAIVPTENGAN